MVQRGNIMKDYIQNCELCDRKVSLDKENYYIYCNNAIEEGAPIICLECIREIRNQNQNDYWQSNRGLMLEKREKYAHKICGKCNTCKTCKICKCKGRK